MELDEIREREKEIVMREWLLLHYLQLSIFSLQFLKALEDQEAVEKEQVIFECQMGDDEADAEWVIAGQVVTESDR